MVCGVAQVVSLKVSEAWSTVTCASGLTCTVTSEVGWAVSTMVYEVWCEAPAASVTVPLMRLSCTPRVSSSTLVPVSGGTTRLS